MKKAITFGLFLAVAFATACSGKTGDTGSSQTAAESTAETGAETESGTEEKTMADVLEFPSLATSLGSEFFAYVYEQEGTLYRAVTKLTPELSDQLFAVDFDDPEYDQKLNGLLGPLPIDRMDNLTEMIPSQEELDAYVGKTGQELFDEGWFYVSYNLEDMEADMNGGLFVYTVKFDYDGEPMENTEDFDFEEAFRDLKVNSVTYSGLGNITADLEAEASD